MAFEIAPVDNDTFAALLTAAVVQQVRDLVFMPSDWATFHNSGPTAIDLEHCCLLLSVASSDKMNANNLYLFLQHGEFALIEEQGFNCFRFIRVSMGMTNRRDEIATMISDALRIGGVSLDGNPGKHAALAVDDARFLN